MQYFNGTNNNIIIIAFQRDCNNDCIDGTNFDGLISWKFNKNYAGRLKTLKDGEIVGISERNYAPNPVDKLAIKTFYLIAKCYLY